MKLYKGKKQQNLFKSNLTKYQAEEIIQKNKKWYQKILNCFKNHKKLLLNYWLIILQLHLSLSKKQFKEKGISSKLGCLSHVAKFSHNWNFKILNLKQMLQRLPTALAQVKTGNTSGSLPNESDQL